MKFNGTGSVNGHDRGGGREMPRIMRYSAFMVSRPDAETGQVAGPNSSADGGLGVGGGLDGERPWLLAFEPEYYERMAGLGAERVAATLAGATAGAGAAAGVGTAEGIEVEPELTDHNYDGIQEYDNPTPGWWHALFLGSVVFSVLYVFVYHLSTAVPSLPERLAIAQTRAAERQFADIRSLPEGEAKIVTLMSNPEFLERGRSIFISKCAQCHQSDGRGSVGPNLTDERYKNIATLMDIPALVRTGTADGSMPSQRNFLNSDEIALVSAFAASLRGQNLPTGETVAPEFLGVPIDPWPVLNERGEAGPGGGRAAGPGATE